MNETLRDRERSELLALFRQAPFAALAALTSMLIRLGWSPVAVLNAMASRTGFQRRCDMAYGPVARHVLDIYVPDPAPASAPVVLFFHGGGAKENYLFVGQALAARGIVVLIPDCRTDPQIGFQQKLRDAGMAVEWARSHGAEIGIEPASLFLMGHCGGARIAALLALDGRWLAEAGIDSRHQIAGLIGLAGPYDILPPNAPASNQEETQTPIHYISAQSPPVLLLAGDSDRIVDSGHSRRLARALDEVGADVELEIYPGLGHLESIGAMTRPLCFMTPMLDDVARFIGAADGLWRRRDESAEAAE